MSKGALSLQSSKVVSLYILSVMPVDEDTFSNKQSHSIVRNYYHNSGLSQFNCVGLPMHPPD